jgi:hypothetical protein
VRRRDGDEAALAARAQRRPRVLGQQERAREQHGQELVPAVLVELGHRGDVLKAGVGHHHVETAEALDGGLDRAAVALARGEVGGVGHAGAVGVRLEIDREDVEAVVDEALGDRATDAAPRAGDESCSLLGHGVNFTVMTSPSRMR